MTLILGIDPGMDGGLALSSGGRITACLPMPVSAATDGKPLTDAARLVELLDEMAPEIIVLERAGPRPDLKRPADTEWRFAMGYAAVLAAIRIYGRAELSLPTSSEWKVAMGMGMPGSSYAERKALSITLAARRHPYVAASIGGHDGIAEAVLLADFELARITRELASVKSLDQHHASAARRLAAAQRASVNRGKPGRKVRAPGKGSARLT